MRIVQYLKENNLSATEFCKKHNFEYGYFRHIVKGRARPSPDLALRIERATQGKVSRLELLYPGRKYQKPIADYLGLKNLS